MLPRGSQPVRGCKLRAAAQVLFLCPAAVTLRYRAWAVVLRLCVPLSCAAWRAVPDPARADGNRTALRCCCRCVSALKHSTRRDAGHAPAATSSHSAGVPLRHLRCPGLFSRAPSLCWPAAASSRTPTLLPAGRIVAVLQRAVAGTSLPLRGQLALRKKTHSRHIARRSHSSTTTASHVAPPGPSALLSLLADTACSIRGQHSHATGITHARSQQTWAALLMLL